MATSIAPNIAMPARPISAPTTSGHGEVLGDAAKQLLDDRKAAKGGYVDFVGILTAQNAIDRMDGIKKTLGRILSAIGSNGRRHRLPDAPRTTCAPQSRNSPTCKHCLGIWSYNAPLIADEVAREYCQAPQPAYHCDIRLRDRHHQANGQGKYRRHGRAKPLRHLLPIGATAEGVGAERRHGNRHEDVPNLGQRWGRYLRYGHPRRRAERQIAADG